VDGKGGTNDPGRGIVGIVGFGVTKVWVFWRCWELSSRLESPESRLFSLFLPYGVAVGSNSPLRVRGEDITELTETLAEDEEDDPDSTVKGLLAS